MEEFLIGASLALLLALLAWSDSISTLRKDTLELEKDFSRERKLNLRRIRTIIRTEMDVAKRITALNELINSTELKKAEDINIIERLSNLDSDRHQLEILHEIKYLLVIFLTYIFLISGIINYFIGETCSIDIFCLSVNAEFIPILACLLLVQLVLFFVLYLNYVENKYKNEVRYLLDEI